MFLCRWRYREQASFAVRQAVHFKAAAAQCRLDEPEWHRPACLLLQLSEEEYMERLDGVAGALRSVLTVLLQKCSGCASS